MTDAVVLPPQGPEDWGAWSQFLASRILELAPDEDLVVTAPSLVRPHRLRERRLFGLVPARHEAVTPWARVRRDGAHAVAELIGSEDFGGQFLTTAEESAMLIAIGWRRPGQSPAEERVWSRWFPDDVAQAAYLPTTEARAAAEFMAATWRDALNLSGS